MREIFPHFMEEMELGRFVRELLTCGRCTAVRIGPHRATDGSPSSHVFDVYRLS